MNVVIRLAALCIFCSVPAFAHDPLTHQANELSKARSPENGLCCDGTDYIVPNDWQQVGEGVYRVRIKAMWFDVPQGAVVINMKNPDMEAKVWMKYNGKEVRCFMAGGQT